MIRKLLVLLALLVLPLVMLRIRYRQRTRLVPQPRGMVLGLYAGLPDYDYGAELTRIAQTGATCVSLQAIYRMEHAGSTEVIRHPTSSPTEDSLRRTFYQARTRGLRMMFFPTINLTNEYRDPTWWRGNIQPRDWEAWWRNYTAFNVRLASLAQEGGVEWYSVGTEMASTHWAPDRWRALVAEVRKVFKGRITYSVNFDAHDSFSFGDCLDVIGMNTYDPIARHEERPTEDQLRDGWWWIVYKARTLRERFGRPVMITEVGYPSVARAHAGPWDFRSAKVADPGLQDYLLKGALKVLRNWQDGDAVFYYLYGEDLKEGRVPGGLQDRTYAPWGKPVEETLRWYFAEPIFEGHTLPKPEDGREAVIQMIAAARRKVRDYEDASIPAWIEAWRVSHPQDWDETSAILAKEPIPLKKIPKGQER
jgi:hypothetical protein